MKKCWEQLFNEINLHEAKKYPIQVPDFITTQEAKGDNSRQIQYQRQVM